MTLVAAEGPLLEQILDASYPLWNDGLTRPAYGRWWEAQLRTPWGRTHLHRYALVDENRVLASAKQYDFDGVLDGREVRVMGIGAVFTQPEARGRGHARSLVEQMLEAGTRKGYDAGLVFSEIGVGYYAALGFEAIDLREKHLIVSEKPGAPATLVRAGDDRDFAAIAALGREGAARFRFHLSRDVELIQYSIVKRRLLAGLGAHGARELHFFVAEEGISAVAYVVISVRPGEWTLEECGDRDPSGARVGAILQVLLAGDPSEKRPTIRGLLPAGFTPPQVVVADERLAAPAMMIRPLGSFALPKLEAADVLFWHSDVF